MYIDKRIIVFLLSVLSICIVFESLYILYSYAYKSGYKTAERFYNIRTTSIIKETVRQMDNKDKLIFYEYLHKKLNKIDGLTKEAKELCLYKNN